MAPSPKLRLACTPGDPAGIGPLVMARALAATHNVSATIERVLIGPRALWRRAFDQAQLAMPDQLACVELGSLSGVELGHASAASAALAVAALEHTGEGLRQQRYHGVVTGPIAKIGANSVGFVYPGHTDFFADIGARMTGRNVPYAMFFRGERMNVVLASIHLSLSQMLRTLNADAVSHAARLVATEGPWYGLAPRPRLWLCGLNPHAGEEGMLGREELEWLNALAQQLRAEGLQVEGPLPPDTAFALSLRATPPVDALVALYHDQGLIPFKLLHFDDGVNVTLGLPFVRTSPDHGTAFALATQPSQVSAQSATAAMQLALMAMERRFG